MSRVCILAALAAILAVRPLGAEVSLPNVFGDHMVLQRDMKIPVWGWAAPGGSVEVGFAGQSVSAVADEGGLWRVELAPVPAGGPHEMTVTGPNTVRFTDALVGEVWFCSGQSNMEWKVKKSDYAQLEIATANHPQIRMLHIPPVGTQEPQRNFSGQWEVCSPETVGDFSAVGYLFGRRLHQALGVPIGLIDNSWGGSAAEAWLPRSVLEAHPQFAELLEQWDADIAALSGEEHARPAAENLEAMTAWEKSGGKGPKPPRVRNIRLSQTRPANIFNGVLHPTIGYAMRGVIWYQGETNSKRAYQYRDLFPLVIRTMRSLWGQGDFPFYWVQLADNRAETKEPGDSDWAELREAQTMTMDALPNTGQAVIIDAGEGRDIHPRDKRTVADRLVLWPLARDYGFDVACQSPRFDAMSVKGNAVAVTFRDVAAPGLYAFDTKEVKGFAIAGEDRQFHWAEATITGPNTVKVLSSDVATPVAVRYAWADNPVANLYDGNGLPVTPFRTDDWPGITADVRTRKSGTLRNQGR